MKLLCREKTHIQWLPVELLYGRKEISDLSDKIKSIPNPYKAIEEAKWAFEDCRAQILKLIKE